MGDGAALSLTLPERGVPIADASISKSTITGTWSEGLSQSRASVTTVIARTAASRPGVAHT
jgi:hypothetical protein